MTGDEISEAEEESDDSTLWSIHRHGGVSDRHRDEEVEIGGEAEGEVGEENARGGGVEVLAESTRDDSPEEGDGDRGDEAEEETEDGHRYADRSSHRIHVHR